MRIKLLIAVAAAIFMAAPGAADVTARYVIGRGNGPVITIQVNDRGDTRIATGNQMAVLVIDGVSYVLLADLSGTFVVRQDDMVAVLGEQFRGMIGDMEMPSPEDMPTTEFVVVERGTETVAGRTGTVWVLRLAGAAGQMGPETRERLDAGLSYVINNDADLAPIGRALVRQYSGSLDGLEAMMGPAARIGWGMQRGIRSILERGTPIRMGSIMRLDSVDTAPIPASVFSLPGTPLTRDEYRARQGGSAPRPN